MKDCSVLGIVLVCLDSLYGLGEVLGESVSNARAE